MKRVNFEILPGGSIRFDAVGYRGKACTSRTKEIVEDFLAGRKMGSDKRKKTTVRVAGKEE